MKERGFSTCLFISIITFCWNVNAVPKAQTPSKEYVDGLIDVHGSSPALFQPACTCVPYYLCNEGAVNTDGADLLDVRGKSECERESVPHVCCGAPLEKPKPRHPPPPPTGRRGCGHRNEQGIGFRVTGTDNEAQFGEFPWMIGMLEKEGNNLVYKCGGSLIHEQVVLTAAHCFYKRDPEYVEMYARAGEWDTQTAKELLPYQQKRIKKIIIHPEYHSQALHYDIALVILEEPFQFTENVDIACLPKTISDRSYSEDCYVSGWGKDKFEREGIYQVILKKVKVPIVSNDICLDKLRTTRLGKHFKLHETFICAGGIPGRDTCKGDGGGPLVCPVEGKRGTYKQVGMVAWGLGCGTEIPAVYVNVPYFKDWIDRKFAELNFHTEYNYEI